MTIRATLAWARQQIEPADAKYLLQELLGVSAAWLIAHDDEPLTSEMEQTYRQLVGQAADDVPIPYLLGRCWFFGRQFSVSPAVLIPRPETEELVQLGLEALKGKRQQQVIDVGTGSGIIAITLALETAGQEHSILATDISAEALMIAKKNSVDLQADLTFEQSDLLKDQAGPFDLIIANLPYIGETEKNVMGASVLKHEPHLALFSQNNGFAHIETLLQQAKKRLSSQGTILLEIGYAQGEEGLALCQQAFPAAKCECITDLAGHDRILRISAE